MYQRNRRGHLHPYVIVLATLLAVMALPAGTVAQPPTPPPVPKVTGVTPAVVAPGDRITIRGRNFVQIRAVTMAGIALKHRVRSQKRITAQAPPYAARGPVIVQARGGVAASPRMVVVKPKLDVRPTSGPIGGSLTVSGNGFTPGEPVDLFFGRLPVGPGSADGRGRLGSTEIVIPDQATPGDWTVRAQGRFSGVPVDVPVVVGVDWPQRGLAPQGNRHNRDEVTVGVTSAPTLTLDWVADTFGPSRSSPAVVGDDVYVGADTRALLRMPIDCATDGTGCDATAIGVATAAISSSPAIADGVAYVGSEDGRLHAFDAACPPDLRPCPPLWSAETGGPITSSPVVTDELVVVGSEDGSVYAFPRYCTAEDCQPTWVGPTGGPVHSSPAAHDGVVYVGSDDSYLYAFDMACASEGSTCSPLWRGWTALSVRSSPAVANGLVYVGSSDGKVRGFPIGCQTRGEICYAIWRGVADGPIESTPVVADGYVVVGTMTGSVMGFPVACADRASGCQPTWTAQTGGPVRSSAAIGGGGARGGAMVFIGSDDGFIYGYPLKCRPAGRPPICPAVWASGTREAISSSPVFLDGALYASSEDGTVRRWSLP